MTFAEHLLHSFPPKREPSLDLHSFLPGGPAPEPGFFILVLPGHGSPQPLTTPVTRSSGCPNPLSGINEWRYEQDLRFLEPSLSPQVSSTSWIRSNPIHLSLEDHLHFCFSKVSYLDMAEVSSEVVEPDLFIYLWIPSVFIHGSKRYWSCCSLSSWPDQSVLSSASRDVQLRAVSARPALFAVSSIRGILMR